MAMAKAKAMAMAKVMAIGQDHGQGHGKSQGNGQGHGHGLCHVAKAMAMDHGRSIADSFRNIVFPPWSEGRFNDGFDPAAWLRFSSSVRGGGVPWCG